MRLLIVSLLMVGMASFSFAGRRHGVVVVGPAPVVVTSPYVYVPAPPVVYVPAPPPPVYYYPHYYSPGVHVRAPFVGVTVGPGIGVSVRAPFTRVHVGRPYRW